MPFFPPGLPLYCRSLQSSGRQVLEQQWPCWRSLNEQQGSYRKRNVYNAFKLTYLSRSRFQSRGKGAG
jgi:hypothetical protein